MRIEKTRTNVSFTLSIVAAKVGDKVLCEEKND